jgi:uncharacterized integral membrane protein
MRYVYIALIVVFTGIVVLFKIQNLEAVTVSLFTVSVTLPVAVLVLLLHLRQHEGVRTVLVQVRLDLLSNQRT